MLRTKGGCRIRRASMSLPCRPAVIFLPLPRCILCNHRQAGDRHRSTGWTGHVLHGSDHGQEGCRLGRHGRVRHQRSFDRCGAVGCGWSCAVVGLASFRDWCFTGDRVDRPRCALRSRKRVEHGERAQLDASASRGRRGEQPHTSQSRCLLDRARIGLASVFHVKPTDGGPSHRRTRSRCDLARRSPFRPRGCGWRARRDLG